MAEEYTGKLHLLKTGAKERCVSGPKYRGCSVQCAIERCIHMVVLTQLSPDGGN